MIYDISPVNNYTGNGSTTQFDFDFYIESASQLKVYLYDTNNTKHELTHNVDYSINELKNVNGSYITFPLANSTYDTLATGEKLSLNLTLPISQGTQYNNSSLLNLTSLEYSLDYLTRLIQIVSRKTSLCVKVEEGASQTADALLADIYQKASMVSQQYNSITNSATQINNNITTAQNLITNINSTAQTAISNIRSTGFYMRNDKLYFINSNNVEQEFLSGWRPFILQTIWLDHTISDSNWLRSDTFSWQSGTTYSTAYNELLSEYNDASSTTKTEGTITYKLTPKGYKIAAADQESAIASLYTTQGFAEYYILDSANTQFKLKRSSKRRLVQCKKATNTDSSWYNVYSDGWCEQGGFIPTQTRNDNYPVTLSKTFAGTNYDLITDKQIITSISTSLAAYSLYTKNKTTTGFTTAVDENVQCNWQASGYLADSELANIPLSLEYFYVGGYSQSAIQQTAGLNSELFNNKVDLNANNLSTAGKALISRLGMPSTRYTALTLGASGTTYTAPANGYFHFLGTTSIANQWVSMFTQSVSATANSASVNFGVPCYVPVYEGETMSIYYNIPATDFGFFYAEGDE